MSTVLGTAKWMCICLTFPERMAFGTFPDTLRLPLTIIAAHNNPIFVFTSILALSLGENFDESVSISLHLIVIYKYSCKRGSAASGPESTIDLAQLCSHIRFIRYGQRVIALPLALPMSLQPQA